MAPNANLITLSTSPSMGISTTSLSSDARTKSPAINTTPLASERFPVEAAKTVVSMPHLSARSRSSGRASEKRLSRDSSDSITKNHQ